MKLITHYRLVQMCTNLHTWKEIHVFHHAIHVTLHAAKLCVNVANINLSLICTVYFYLPMHILNTVFATKAWIKTLC